MEIDIIFAEKLYAFHYKNEELNELNRIIGLWNDISYLYDFYKKNNKDLKKYSIKQFVKLIIEDANKIDDKLYELANNKNESLDNFFIQLDNNETAFKILSFRKGRKNILRVYALKIDDNCFIVTGGAIKLSLEMKDRDHTFKELQKLHRAKDYLTENGVTDFSSFYEFLNESL